MMRKYFRKDSMGCVERQSWKNIRMFPVTKFVIYSWNFEINYLIILCLLCSFFSFENKFGEHSLASRDAISHSDFKRVTSRHASSYTHFNSVVLSLLIKKFKSSTTSVYLEQPGFSSYNPLILVFQYFFIHKILVHPKKSGKSEKIQFRIFFRI